MIYVGTCGYAYKDWIGPFYPGKIRSNEMLPYYARCFPAVEIDSSYYGVPSAATIERMDRNTPPEFRFCFKVPSTVTHPPEAVKRVHPDARLFVESVGLLKEGGKLGCALLQFPNGFRNTPAANEYLRLAVEALAPLPLVAEFRNREWQNPATIELLRRIGRRLVQRRHAAIRNADAAQFGRYVAHRLSCASTDATRRNGGAART